MVCAHVAAEMGGPPRLDPSLEWNLVGSGDRLQLRFPDGQSITFDRDVARLDRCLAALAAGTFEADDVGLALLSLLRERSALTVLDDAGADWAIDIYEFAFRRAQGPEGAPRSDVNAARGTPLCVFGSGWMQEQALAAAEALGMRRRVLIDELGPDGLLLVTSDRYDPDFFRSANRQAVSTGARAVFAHRQLSRIVVGPLVLPRESACYECYFQRQRAASRFKAEFDSRVRAAAAARATAARSPSRVAAGLCQSLLALLLLAAAARAYDVFEPGTLVSFDVLTLEKSRQPVLRLPRCSVCSDAGSRPGRAVRELV